MLKPLKTTKKLIKQYGIKLLKGTITDNELKTLAVQKNFEELGSNKQQVMVNFTIILACFLNEKQLHETTSKLIKFDQQASNAQKNTFWRNSVLSKYFAAYETINTTTSTKISQLPKKLKDHIFTHKLWLCFQADQNKNLTKALNSMFGNALKLTAKTMHGPKYEITCNIPQQNFTDSPQKKVNDGEQTTTIKLISQTSEFAKLKQHVFTLIKRATDANLEKAYSIQQIINAVETNKSDEDILSTITQYEKNIIKNTGTGCYTLFNSCCNDYQSTSHKLLYELKTALENQESNDETSPLLK